MAQLSAQESSETLDLRTWLRLLNCAKIIEKRLRRNFEIHFGTTLPRFDVLATLDHLPAGQSMGALSRALLVSNGNVTAIVRQLVGQGYLTYVADPEDGRSAIVALTARGKAYFDELAAAHREWVTAALRDFSDADKEQLLILLSRMSASISRNG